MENKSTKTTKKSVAEKTVKKSTPKPEGVLVYEARPEERKSKNGTPQNQESLMVHESRAEERKNKKGTPKK